MTASGSRGGAYRAAAGDDSYSVTDEPAMRRRRWLYLLFGRAAGAMAVFVGLLGLAALVAILSGSDGVSGNPFALGLFVVPLLFISMVQGRAARRFVRVRIGRDGLILDGEGRRSSIPWSDVHDARAGRALPLQREVAGFLSIRASDGGAERQFYTVAPGAEAARHAAEEIRRRAALARGVEA